MKKIKVQNRLRFTISLVILILLTQLVLNLVIGFDHVEGKTSQEYTYMTYEIKRNDTLWDIASLYKANYETIPEYVKEIKRINNMQSNNICVGQTIIIPTFD